MYSNIEQTYSGKNNENLFSAFLGWWFSDLPKKIIFISTSYIKKISRFFSIGILFKTLLSPWKRDITNTQGTSLQQHLEILVMNIISRLIGLIIRLVTIIIAVLLIIIVFIASICFLLIMLLMPLFVIAIIVLSL